VTDGGALDLREISRAALVTAAGLALPWVFHALRLGHVFLPMYLPLLAGAFVLRPRTATAAAVATPLVSAAATGMPLLVWHDVGRERLAAIHGGGPPPIREDLLPPVGRLAAIAAAAGFVVERADEDEDSYTLLARRPSLG
jgi:hypothetical protein